MRTLGDRIRHTVFFEIIGILCTAVGGSLITGHSVEEMGMLGIIFSLLAMVWNFSYNWMVDIWDLKYRNAAPRGVLFRTIHAIFFEAGMLIAGIFIVAHFLNISYLDALILDIGFSVFFLIYAFCYNWAYDLIFPVPKPA
ncbi:MULTISPECIES: PACE efflux transporter [Curvivirga]|uniref:PACE efflux transporter n=1 Tax=Curvivirga TaxID=2856846 RepID=UPI0012BC7042|nr:PACE efflux transporter [Curvivirga aplysinae]MTI09878.1 PACE efflux transporter [Curvivirga aplysinae]